VVELIVQVDRGADQGQVAERLREVAELLAGASDLLGVQPQVKSRRPPRVSQIPSSGWSQWSQSQSMKSTISIQLW
jgi:hypothetical protein